MKNVKDLGPNDVIHCRTEEEAEAIVQLMKYNGANWGDTFFDVYENETVYRPYSNTFNSASLSHLNNDTIHLAADFIKNNNMAQLTIEIPDGHEVDQENSDLAKGVVKFKPIKKVLPTKWEDIVCLKGYYVSTDASIRDWVTSHPGPENKNLWPTEELAKASLALCQLVRFRDIYNEGWQPDWRDSMQNKHVIIFSRDKKNISIHSVTQGVLTFKDYKTANLFSDTFKDLIEEAKPLL